MSKTPKFKYVVASLSEREHVVFCVHDDTPDWWRRIATFHLKVRADDYAQMETMFSEDFDDPLEGRGNDFQPAPADLPALPPSALKSSEFVRRSTVVEHTRIAQVEERAVQPPEFVVDAATLDPVTSGQLEIFNLMASLNGEYLSITQIAERTTVALGSVATHLQALCKKGYLNQRDIGGARKAYDVIVRGTPGCMDTDNNAAKKMAEVRSHGQRNDEIDAGIARAQLQEIKEHPERLVHIPPGETVEGVSSVALLPPILNEKSNMKNEAQPIDGAPQQPEAELIREGESLIGRAIALGQAPQKPPIDLVDAATLDPVTEKQAKVLHLVVDMTASGERAGLRNTAEKAGYASVQDSLEALVKRGYLVRAGEMGGIYWVPLAQGVPRIDDMRQNWTDAQRKGLRDVCEAGGDVAAFALSIGRTEGACLSRARALGIFEKWRAARWPDHVDDPEEITSIDLTPRQQILLHAIVTEGGGAIHATKHNLEPDRVPDILKRLEGHGCVVIGEGGWQPTDLGKKVYEQIKAHGLPTLPALPTKGREVKISMPVVRRVNGEGKEIKPAEDAKTYALFDIETYLRHKHHAVQKLTSGEFVIDGARKSKAAALAIVNDHRAKADLHPLPVDQVK